jgi:hypothetical protein
MTKQQHKRRKEHNGKLPHYKRVTRRTHARRNEEWNSANELDAASSFHFFTARSATYSFSMRITCRQATRSEVEVEPRFLYDKIKPLDADSHVASEPIIQLQHAVFGNHLNQQCLSVWCRNPPGIRRLNLAFLFTELYLPTLSFCSDQHLLLPLSHATLHKTVFSPSLLSSSSLDIHPHQHPTQHYAAFIPPLFNPSTTDSMQFTATSLLAMASMSTGESLSPLHFMDHADNRQLLSPESPTTPPDPSSRL